MESKYGKATFVSSKVEETLDGYVGMELRRVTRDGQELAASVVYWDATGQFVVRINVDELPLSILEELVAEAKELVK